MSWFEPNELMEIAISLPFYSINLYNENYNSNLDMIEFQVLVNDEIYHTETNIHQSSWIYRDTFFVIPGFNLIEIRIRSIGNVKLYNCPVMKLGYSMGRSISIWKSIHNDNYNLIGTWIPSVKEISGNIVVRETNRIDNYEIEVNKYLPIFI